MSLSDQATALMQQGAAVRQATFGASGKISYASGAQIDGYWSPVRNQQQLDEAGFRDLHDTIVRVLKTNLLNPAIGSLVDLYDSNGQKVATVRHKETGIGALVNPEWVLGCDAEF